MITTAQSVSPRRIVRILVRVANGVTTSDHLAKLLSCEPDELLEPLSKLADADKVLLWQARHGGLGVMLARTNQPKIRRTYRKAATGMNLDALPDQKGTKTGQYDDHCYGMPYPWIILLGYRTHWPNPRWTQRSPCPVCGGRPISVDSYCLVCDRWGRDGGTWGRRKGPEPIRTKLTGSNGLKGGRG